MRPAGVQALPHVLKQALHPRVVQVLSPVRQSLHKAAHVRALERSGQIHADVHIGDRMLRPLRAIPHQQRQLQPFDPYPVDGQRHRSRTVLYVFHSFPLSYSLITKKRHPGIVQRLFFIWASPPVADPHAGSPTSNGTPDAQPPHQPEVCGGRGWRCGGRGGKPFFRKVPSPSPDISYYGKSAPMVVIEKVPCVTPRIERS